MKKILVLFIATSLLFSCKKSLTEDPRGQISGENALNSLNGLNAALVGAYKPLSNTWTSGFATAALNATLMGSDDLTTHPGSNKQEFRDLDQFSVSNLNSRVFQIWSGTYKSIQGANNIINNYQLVTTNPNEVKQILGEAYFLRAFNYYWLVRLWGDIPLIKTAAYIPELSKISKSSPAEVYKLIEEDLIQAETLLGNSKLALGRASKGSAKALLADVYLTEAGWPLKNISKLALAASKAKEVIDNKALYGFDITTPLSTLWGGTAAAVGTPEEVFALQFCPNCNWFNSNAVYGNACMSGDENGWDDYFSEINFFNNFPAGLRKDLTFQIVINGAPWQNSTTGHPYFGKFRVNGGQTTWQTSQSLPLIRYAHVLLIYAEAKARSGSLDPSAYSAVNTIRTRAGLPNLIGLSAADFATAVVKERSWEFAGEWTRWFDLTRLEMVESANAGKNSKDLPVIGPIKYYVPIPASEVALNPNLK